MSGTGPDAPESPRRRPDGRVLVAGAVLLLAAAAVLIPRATREEGRHYLLVIDPLGGARRAGVHESLAAWLGEVAPRPLRLRLAASPAELAPADWEAVDLVFCPDGTALDLVATGYAGVAAARRPAPENRRPRSCLVYRKAAGLVTRPWREAPARTLLGDSLSLAGCGVVCPRGRSGAGGTDWPEGLRCGPDPYDHAPVLHALRLGAADYAVVREVAVHRFLDDGLLDPLVWGVRELSEPLPDAVVLVSRRWSTADRVRLGEALLGLGRREGAGQDGERAAVEGLGRLGLGGFNLLLDPELEQLRRHYDHCWPPSGF